MGRGSEMRRGSLSEQEGEPLLGNRVPASLFTVAGGHGDLAGPTSPSANPHRHRWGCASTRTVTMSMPWYFLWRTEEAKWRSSRKDMSPTSGSDACSLM